MQTGSFLARTHALDRIIGLRVEGRLAAIAHHESLGFDLRTGVNVAVRQHEAA